MSQCTVKTNVFNTSGKDNEYMLVLHKWELILLYVMLQASPFDGVHMTISRGVPKYYSVKVKICILVFIICTETLGCRRHYVKTAQIVVRQDSNTLTSVCFNLNSKAKTLWPC